MVDPPAPHLSDPEAVLEKYRAERDKRLQPTRGDIPELVDDLAHYLDDPYATPVGRAGVDDEVDVVIVGAGLTGLLLGAELRKVGVARVRLVDSAGEVGGVWYWNRYPGAMCDVESLIYMPLLEELQYTPTKRYADAAEIEGHCRAIAKLYDLYDLALFHTTVTGAEWDEEGREWVTTTDRGDRIRSQFVILAEGPISRPKLPAVPGIETFEGTSFHTSRWDYAYTGGGPNEPMDRLGDKRVGIVGTGATGIQCVPPLGRDAGHLYVFQRTPSTVAIRNNRAVDPGWVADQEPGWQARRRKNFTAILSGDPVAEDLVSDSWTQAFTRVPPNPRSGPLAAEQGARARVMADLSWMEAIRQRIHATVRDPDTAEALKPWYQYHCKRPGFHDEYLDTFNRPNVTLVDTDGRGLEAVYEHGVVVGGRRWELDCLVFATGFDTETSYVHRIGFDVVGRDDLTLSRKWGAGLSTLHGLMTSGFPNLFVMPGVNSQSVVTTNLMDLASENTHHVAHIIGEVRARAARTFDVDMEAERAWVRLILDNAVDREAFLRSCTPSRFNNEGRLDARPKQNTNWGKSPQQFFNLLAQWRDDGGLAGLLLDGEPRESRRGVESECTTGG